MNNGLFWLFFCIGIVGFVMIGGALFLKPRGLSPSSSLAQTFYEIRMKRASIVGLIGIIMITIGGIGLSITAENYIPVH